MVNLIDKYKQEFAELFAERKERATKNTVFRLMSDIADAEEQIAALDVQKDLLVEKKEKLVAELNALGGN